MEHDSVCPMALSCVGCPKQKHLFDLMGKLEWDTAAD